jgi:hypothetical protein
MTPKPEQPRKDRRIVQIGCAEPRREEDVVCGPCGLPLRHHQVRFEILSYDDFYDVYVLNAITHGEFDPNRSVSPQTLLLHVSTMAFGLFRECA